MGKKSFQKDRAYITASEWREEGGGHKGRLQGAQADFRRLPFNCCAITFKPVEDAVVTDDGTVMDITSAVPYIQKFHSHPTTGEPLELKQLTRVNFHHNTDGEICCPVLGKVFNENTHIVAIKPSGNVYCFEAIKELCIKSKNLRDLITDEPFKKSDIIDIQDPMKLAGKNFAQFDHVKNNKLLEDEQEAGGLHDIKAMSGDTRKIMASLGTEDASLAFASGGGGKKAEAERTLAAAKAGASKLPVDMRLRSEVRNRSQVVRFKPGTATWNTDEAQGDEDNKEAGFDANAGKEVPRPFSYEYVESHVSTGAASKSFTSTAMNIATKNERERVLKELKPKKKGYLRMHTNLGDLNIELHCDIVPKTCENFLALAEGKYYDGTIFHRSIPSFMIQGGDPTGTGKGGSSVFGGTFEDEMDTRLVHDGRGVISMANSGKNSNGSQFFILYKSARHLDFKHTVFGKVVGGFDTLTKMEKIPTDDEDCPLQSIEIQGFEVFVNPYREMIEEQKLKAAELETKEPSIKSLDQIMGSGKRSSASGVGRFIEYAKVHQQKQSADAQHMEEREEVQAYKKAKASSKLTNFDAW